MSMGFSCLLAIISATGVMPLEIIPRVGWGARRPTLVENMTNPVPYVIIHHSYIPPACSTFDSCIQSMQEMQNMHQIKNGWNDIGYHFGVGGDGRAYEGRGWSRVGAHAPKFNNISIGICVIGDWTQTLPPENQLKTVHELINFGVELGMIKQDYILLGHRQVRDTECPGQKLYEEVMTWDHYMPGSLIPTDGKEKEKRGNGGNKLFFFKGKS